MNKNQPKVNKQQDKESDKPNMNNVEQMVRNGEARNLLNNLAKNMLDDLKGKFGAKEF